MCSRIIDVAGEFAHHIGILLVAFIADALVAFREIFGLQRNRIKIQFAECRADRSLSLPVLTFGIRATHT